MLSEVMETETHQEEVLHLFCGVVAMNVDSETCLRFVPDKVHKDLKTSLWIVFFWIPCFCLYTQRYVLSRSVVNVYCFNYLQFIGSNYLTQYFGTTT